MTRVRTLLWFGVPLLVSGLILLGFGWGFSAHRSQTFPYAWLKASREATVEALRPAEPEQAGRWRKLDGRRPWMREDPQAFTWDQLEALGYAEGTTLAPEQYGLIQRSAYAFPGLSLVTSGHAPQAELLDLDGELVHRWSITPAEVFPEADADGRGPRPYFRRAKLLPDGSILALFVGAGAFRLDRDSQVVWRWAGEAHHDLAADGQGGVWVLARRATQRPQIHADGALVEDELVRLSLADGRELHRFSLADALVDSPFEPLLRARLPAHDGDVFHSNTVRVLDGRFADRLPAFTAGRLMVSMRHLNLVIVVDPTTAQVVWAWRGPWYHQHEPTLVEPGHLLIFDNLGVWPRSRVIEVDPLSQRIVWSFDGGRQPLISETCGTGQRLPNGNTIAVASDTGRAVEVDADGRVVWAWTNPARAGDDDDLIATLFQAERVWGAALGPFADRVDGPSAPAVDHAHEDGDPVVEPAETR